MNFIYRTKDKEGLDHKGEIEAADQRAAATLLHKRGFVVLALKPKSETEGGSLLDRFFSRVTFSDLVDLTRQLATMVGAGLVVSEALDILQDQQSNKVFKKTLEEISSDVKGGLTLGQAMSKHPQVFPVLYVNLIKSGETAGKIDQVLLRMADNLEKQREFKARVKGAMIYPVVVITMMIGVMFLMFAFVIPRLTAIYTQSSMQLPLPTRILITVSNLTAGYWYVIILIIITIILIFKRWKQTPEGHLSHDKLLLRLPLMGNLTTNVNLADFTRTFGLLVSAGIPLLEAINIVEGVTGNQVFKNSLKQAYVGVERGLPFSNMVSGDPFPRIVGQMVRVGEETGKMDEVFFKLSAYFETESDNLVKNLTTAIEPIVLVILGLGVAFLVISIILPIYNLTSSF
ncbi:MAG: type II secretion system F family protein [Candidatus Daviesbacteria bacterium]|nr:MAG: type II secretion system F family protein [Candidatus Daviesbacteria bacterium]